MNYHLHSRKPGRGLWPILLAVSFIAPLVLASDEEAAAESGRNYGRVGAIEGGLFGFAPGGDEPDMLLKNAPVYPGLYMVTEAASRAAVVLADGSELFLDESSALEVMDLGDEKTAVAAVFRLEKGGVLLRKAGGKGEIVVQSGEGSMRVSRAGLYRMDALPGGGARVSVFEGTAKVSSGADSRYLDSGQRIAFEPFGSLEGEPETLRGVKDSLYQWARAQGYAMPYYADETLQRRAVADYGMPSDAARYAADFDRYGTWHYYPVYGTWVWAPYPLYADWRPYSWGYWCPTPAGYYWVGYEPWGWAPYRYGRWTWTVELGWVWIPGRMYSPAWVSWTYWDGYVGWCPLGFYGRPATTFIGISWSGGYCSGWSFIVAGDFFYLHYGRSCYPYSYVRSYVPTTVNIYTQPVHIVNVVNKSKGPRPPFPGRDARGGAPPMPSPPADRGPTPGLGWGKGAGGQDVARAQRDGEPGRGNAANASAGRDFRVDEGRGNAHASRPDPKIWAQGESAIGFKQDHNPPGQDAAVRGRGVPGAGNVSPGQGSGRGYDMRRQRVEEITSRPAPGSASGRFISQGGGVDDFYRTRENAGGSWDRGPALQPGMTLILPPMEQRFRGPLGEAARAIVNEGVSAAAGAASKSSGASPGKGASQSKGGGGHGKGGKK